MIKLTDKNYKTYLFDTFPVNSYTIPKKAGIYAFLKVNDVIYIGQTENFYERLYLNFEQHQAYNCILRNKADSVALYYFDGNERQRIDIETNLRHNHSTPCNLQ